MGFQRTERGRRKEGKLGHVRTGRQADAKFRIRSYLAVVLEKPLAHVAGSHANYCVIRGVVCGRPSEQCDAEAAFPQVRRIAMARPLNYVLPEALASRPALKSGAL